jgi:Undecaprenyl-phosphate galactose phosphotransferase WbaP
MTQLIPAATAAPSLWLAGVLLLPLLAGYWLGGIYSEIWIHPAVEFRQLTHISTIMLLGALAGGALAGPYLIEWAAVAWAVTVILVPLLRNVARACCVHRSWWGYPTVIIGAGPSADEAARLVLDCARSGLKPLALTDPQGQCPTSVLPVVNDPAALEVFIRTHGIRHAVVSLPNYSHARLSAALDRYGNLLPHLLVLSDTATLPMLWGASRSGGRLSGIEVRNDLLLATLQVIKRIADVLVASVCLILGLPLLMLIGLLIKVCSPGPALFAQPRIGREGRTFNAWKFRTMYVDGDRILREYLERIASAREEWERDRKLRQDPRITPLGRFLRRTSMDELPQLWNVLRGDMSIVGPRPIVDAEIERYAEVFHLYTRLKPGITGLWQVSGRNDVSYDDRVRLDQFYIRHWSPWLDAYILAKTVVALLKREGAY